ncbi:MAG: TrkH family potassium uptake protein [Planctomycetes bacterium]|nr:TrkH family potassium uptake protein [Planctomycetota bacterium]
MNLNQVARLMAGFAGLFSLAQLPPLVSALTEDNRSALAPIAGFASSIVVGLVVAGLLWLAGRRDRTQIFRKETIAVAGLSWFLAGMIGAIPFWVSGLLDNPIDAFFEAMSGLTTCGATVLGSGGNIDIDQVAPSLLLWRSMLQWIGGIGIVLVFVALLPAVGVSAKNLLSSESVGVATDSYLPRAVEKARYVATIYIGMTALCTVLLALIGGFGWFDAMCHAFTTMATGGYSTKASLAEFHSLGGEIVLIVFMFLAGASLAVVATHCRTGVRCLLTLVRSAEFRTYALCTAVLIAILTVALMRSGAGFGHALRLAAFNGVSVLTSTGYATSDFQGWPSTATLCLFAAMFVGGCSGSTAGGFKQVRLLVMLRLLGYTLRQFLRPKSVERIKLDNEVLPASVMSSILAIVLLWGVTIMVGAVLISFDERLNFLAAFAASASMVGSCGPAMTIADPSIPTEAILAGAMASPIAGTPHIGPFGGYGDLQGWTKLLLSVQMVFGRLELLTVLALFSPNFWRR